MWHLTCDTWQVTSDMWHLTCDTGHMTHGMVWWTLWENLLVHSSLGLGIVEKWHATPDTWHVTCDTWQVVSKCIIYPPRKYKNIWLGSKLSIFSKKTSFLLKLHLHCNLSNFRYVSKINAMQSYPITKKCSFLWQSKNFIGIQHFKPNITVVYFYFLQNSLRDTTSSQSKKCQELKLS